MLQFLVGAAGTGKTTRLVDKLAQSVEEGNRAILLVPEQFSFEGERLVHRRLGPRKALQVEVLSFTRLCDSIFREYGGMAGVALTPTAKYLLMSVAVDELRETLCVYRKSASNTAFLETMVAACSELKTAGVTPRRLEEFARDCDTPVLGEKARELSALYGAYQGLLAKGYADPDDNLIRACQLLENNRYFERFHVFVDGFTTFMAAEFELLGHIITQSPRVLAAMTADAVPDRQRGMGVFSPVQRAMRRMMRMAEKAGTAVEPPELLETPHRFLRGELAHLSRHYLQPSPAPYPEAADSITLYSAADSHREMAWVAATIARLVQEEGYRYRDIAVVARDTQPYRTALEVMFPRYDIPYFADWREDVESHPLIAGVLAAIDAVRSNFDPQPVLLLAKSPILGLAEEDVALLENYCYSWGVRGAVWTGEFANNPRGMAEELTEEDRALLLRINAIRQAVAEPLLPLRQALRNGSGRSFASGIYQFLQDVQAPVHLTAYGKRLGEGWCDLFLDQAAQLWDLLMDILDVFGAVLGAASLSQRRLCELFRLAVGAAEVAEIPQTLDQVIVGQADRIRPGDVRAVFVIGANEGSFPRQAASSGVFTDGERQELVRAGLELSAPSLEQAVLEKFFAYFAVTLPRERLYLSYAKSDLQGRELLPSLLVGGLKELFPSCESKEAMRPMDQILGVKSAFAVLSECYREDSVLCATLRRHFADHKSGALKRMEQASRKSPHQLMGADTAARLFGGRLRLSPSRVERYYRCPFSYFAADGLHLRKRRRVEFSPLESGSVIHNVMQVMVQRHGGRGLALLEDKQLEEEIRGIIQDYLEQRIEDMETLPARFQYLFGRLVGMLTRLLRHLGEEFAQSEFEPVAFELPISKKEGVEPLELRTAAGASVLVEGVVDRVDIMEKNGRRYVRVVDYKSGQKDFKLHEVLYGLNLQMLLYLFTIEENGQGPLADCIPAGVLYMPVREQYISAGRQEPEAKTAAAQKKQWRMSGLLLEDEDSLRGMEREIRGIFIPAKLDKQGRPDASSSLASREELGKLSEKVRELVAQMASSLGKGRISSCPADGADHSPCQYCDYRSVCGFEPGDAVRTIAKMDRDKVFAELEKTGAIVAEEGR